MTVGTKKRDSAVALSRLPRELFHIVCRRQGESKFHSLRCIASLAGAAQTSHHIFYNGQPQAGVVSRGADAGLVHFVEAIPDPFQAVWWNMGALIADSEADRPPLQIPL